MTLTDKEKVKRVLNMVDDLVTSYQNKRQIFITSDQPDKTELIQKTLDDLQEIREILDPEN